MRPHKKINQRWSCVLDKASAGQLVPAPVIDFSAVLTLGCIVNGTACGVYIRNVLQAVTVKTLVQVSNDSSAVAWHR